MREFCGINIMHQLFLAKALYDNVAETGEELAFRRGEVLTVLEQDTGGLAGWWLCSLGGRHGIAPANRLKILSGMVGDGGGTTTTTTTGGGGGGGDGDWLMRSLEKSSSKGKRGEDYQGTPQQRSMEDYDVPPSRRHCSKEPSPAPPGQHDSDIYDIPNSLPVPGGNHHHHHNSHSHSHSHSSRNNSRQTSPCGSRHASCERTPPGSQRTSMDSVSSGSSFSSHHRMSTDSNSAGGQHQQPPNPQQQHFQTLPSGRRKAGGHHEGRPRRLSERLPDTPPSSQRASVERSLGLGGDDQPIYDTPSPAARPLGETPCGGGGRGGGDSTYDTPSPSSSRRPSRCCDPQGQGHSHGGRPCSSNNNNDVAGRRGVSGGSLPDSARSSLDASLHDGDDLPQAREGRALTQLSCDSGLGLYDCPSSSSSPSRQPTSPQPPSSSLPMSPDFHPAGGGGGLDLKRSLSTEHALDDIYDCPRNNAPRVPLKDSAACSGSNNNPHNNNNNNNNNVTNDANNAVYDIPPQVTRDSVISARSDSSSEDSRRLSSCSSDSRGSGAESGSVLWGEAGVLGLGQHGELLLDVDSALELLTKRLQDLTRASGRVLGLVCPEWRTTAWLQAQLSEVRTACGELRRTLGDFLDLAQAAAANTLQLPDRKLTGRLTKHMAPLLQHKRALGAALLSLEDRKWQVALLALEADPPVAAAASDSSNKDDLDLVVSLAGEVVSPAKKLASLLQTNAALVFRKAGDGTSHRRGSSSDDGHVVSKPPIGPRGEMWSKPGGGVGGGVVIPRTRTMQQRPLPAPPASLSDRPLPPTPLQQKLRDLELAGGLDPLDYINIGDPAHDFADRDYSDLTQDYDYVSIDDDCDLVRRRSEKRAERKADLSSKKEEQKNCEKKSSTEGGHETEKQQQQQQTGCGEEEEEPDTPTTDKQQSIKNRGVPENENENDNEKDEEDSSSEDQKTPMNKTNGFTIPDVAISVPSRTPAPTTGHVDLGPTSLTPGDKQVLAYYSGQLETHGTLLHNAIDGFLGCMQGGAPPPPPQAFISNSKFVIVTAHKLVYISDALHRSLNNGAVKSRVLQCADHVCQCLKVSVQATKSAALQYPSQSALQDMVDRVVDVSHAAHELKMVINQASAL